MGLCTIVNEDVKSPMSLKYDKNPYTNLVFKVKDTDAFMNANGDKVYINRKWLMYPTTENVMAYETDIPYLTDVDFNLVQYLLQTYFQ
jgi:hypothetical protein